MTTNEGRDQGHSLFIDFAGNMRACLLWVNSVRVPLHKTESGWEARPRVEAGHYRVEWEIEGKAGGRSEVRIGDGKTTWSKKYEMKSDNHTWHKVFHVA